MDKMSLMYHILSALFTLKKQFGVNPDIRIRIWPSLMKLTFSVWRNGVAQLSGK
jgi:hypothetical protein